MRRYRRIAFRSRSAVFTRRHVDNCRERPTAVRPTQPSEAQLNRLIVCVRVFNFDAYAAHVLYDPVLDVLVETPGTKHFASFCGYSSSGRGTENAADVDP